MIINVSDVRSNPSDQIAHVVQVLGRSKQRLAIFKAIYFGKKRVKSVNEIALSTGLKNKRVLEEGKLLADNQIVKQVRLTGITAYEKDPFYSANKAKILRFVQDPIAFSNMPTKTRPKITTSNITIQLPKKRIQVRYITIDDIDSFSRVNRIHFTQGSYFQIPETRFKNGIAKILGESGKFQDWGGERNDLYTNKVRIAGKRLPAAFAFKGPGTRGILTPRSMGKHGDQIQRLFKTVANVFIVQYWGQIDASIIEQMEEFAKAKSAVDGTFIYYGIIDGDDSNRIIKAYYNKFRVMTRTGGFL